MGLVDIKEIPEDETVTDSGDVRSHVRGFRIFFTAGTGERPIHARFALGFRKGEQHPADPLARVDTVSAQLEHSIYNHPEIGIPCTTFRATVTYNTSERTRFENPCDEPPIRTWSTITTEIERDKDHEGKPVLNSAKDPVIGVTEPVYTWVFSWTKNIPKKDWNPDTYKNWLNRTNQGTWNGLDENTVKFVDISVSEQKQEIVDNKDFYFYTMTLIFHILQDADVDDEGEPVPRTWRRKVVDAGLQYLDSEGKKHPIEVDGVAVTTPQLLDGEGGVLEDPDENDPHYLEFQLSEMKNFGDFPLEVTLV